MRISPVLAAIAVLTLGGCASGPTLYLEAGVGPLFRVSTVIDLRTVEHETGRSGNPNETVLPVENNRTARPLVRTAMAQPVSDYQSSDPTPSSLTFLDLLDVLSRIWSNVESARSSRRMR